MPTKKSAKKIAKKPTKKIKTPSSAKRTANPDFQSTFDGLKKILQKHKTKLFVKKDQPGDYVTESLHRLWRGQRMFFAAAIIKKTYVSFHLMALYIKPDLLKTVPPELKRRMQGKACFNFTAPDPKVFAQLATVAQACLDAYDAMENT
jgi:hypothetical protein